MTENKAIEALKELVAATREFWTDEKIELVESVLVEPVRTSRYDEAFEIAEALIKEHDSKPVDSPDKEKVFRIIELPTHQVLISKEYDDDDDIHQVSVSFSMKSAKISVKLGSKKGKEDRDKLFDDFSVEQAQKIINKFALTFEEEEEGYVNPIEESY